jgi:hypothetical protein
VVAIYVASLLFGGLLIGATLLGAADHSVDAHAGGASGDAHAGPGQAGPSGWLSGWLSLFGLRFWSFAAAFFGVTGLVVHAAGARTLGPWLAGAAGAAAGLTASSLFRKLARDSVGEVGDAASLVGREGRLLLPVGGAGAQRGKVRLPSPAGGSVDLLAESAAGETEPLAAGTAVLVVEVRGNVAVVAPVPGSSPPTPGHQP